MRILLRLGVAAALLGFVFRFALPESGEGIVSALASSWQVGAGTALWYFVAAFAILGISFMVGASRFSILLEGAGVAVGWLSLFRAYLVAGFFNLVLPGAILGDVYRLWDVREEAGQGSRALGVLVVERLASLAALGSLGLAAAPFIPLGTLGDGKGSLATVLALACGAIAASTAAALHPASNGFMRRILARLPERFDRVARALDGALIAVSEISAQPRLIARAFGLSLANQGLPVLAVYALSIPLAGDVPFTWFVVIVPFVTLVSLVPISIGGTGVRESLYVMLFGAVGMPREAALALSLSVLATAIVWAIIGFAIFCLDRRTSAASRDHAPSSVTPR